MRRDVCWVERLEDGVKREIRVSLHAGTIRWRFQRSDTRVWDYDSKPTEDDWATLSAKAESRYFRRQMPLKDLELIRRRGAQ